MWPLVVEAILNGGLSWGLLLEGFCEAIKIGDLVSDILFIITLWKFDSVMGDANASAPEYYKINQQAYLISSIAFTAVGFVFSLGFGLVLFRRTLKKLCQANPTDFDKVNARKKRNCWNQINFWLEDFPQFLIMLTFLGSIIMDEFLPCNSFLDTETLAPTEVQCTVEQEEYISELEKDGLVSFFFSCATLFRSIMFCYHALCNCECCICCDRENEQVTPTSSSWEEDKTSRPQSMSYPPASQVHPPQAVSYNETVTETTYPDGSKIIRTEVLSGDGTTTTTTTTHIRPDDNFCEL